MKRILFSLLLFSVLLTACGGDPVRPIGDTATKFTSGRVVFYGQYYASDSLQANVLMLDIYSDGVELDADDHIVGSGTNLCLSDVFLAPSDSMLQEGVSYRTEPDGTLNSFLPGQNFDGSINGAYLLQIVDGNVSSITLVKEGFFDVVYEGDTTQIDFNFVLASGKKYKAQFRAPLTYTKQ